MQAGTTLYEVYFDKHLWLNIFCNPTCSIALTSLSCKIIVMKSLFCCVFTVCVYYFCRFWISKYGLEFKKDMKLVSLLNQFSEIVDCKGDKSVIDNSNM